MGLLFEGKQYNYCQIDKKSIHWFHYCNLIIVAISGHISAEDFNHSIVLCLYASKEIKHFEVDFSPSSYGWSYISSGEELHALVYIKHNSQAFVS